MLFLEVDRNGQPIPGETPIALYPAMADSLNNVRHRYGIETELAEYCPGCQSVCKPGHSITCKKEPK